MDDDFVVCESRAILAYLVSQFEPESDLLPKDPRKRANVDQRLYYDATVVFEKVIALIVSLSIKALLELLIIFYYLFIQRLGFQKDIKLIPHETRGATWNMLTRLDELLKQSDYIAGENLTIADFSIITSVSTLNVRSSLLKLLFNYNQDIFLKKFGYDLSAYEHLNKWFENLHSLPYFEENLAGAEVIADKLKSAFDGPLY